MFNSLCVASSFRAVKFQDEKNPQSNTMFTIILLLQTECKTTSCKKNKSGFNPDMNTESMTASKHPTTTSIVRWMNVSSPQNKHIPTILMHSIRYHLISTCAGEYDWLFHWQHKLCATFSANVNINYRLPIKVYYRICTLRHIRIELNDGSQNVFWVLTWIGGYK
jgi:hypothetical protein